MTRPGPERSEEQPGRPPGEQAARRWRLLLGGPAEEPLDVRLGKDDAAMDAALASLYDRGEDEPGE